MNNDKPLVAILLGIIATIPFQLLTMVSKYLGFAIYTLYELDSLVITGNRTSSLVGFFVSCIVGGFIGFVFYYGLPKVGTDYLVIKGLCFGVFFTAFFEVILTFVLEGSKIPFRPMAGYYTQFLGAIVFGITMGILFKNYLIESVTRAK